MAGARWSLLLAAGVLVWSGCDSEILEDQEVRVDATGAVRGFVIVDVDGDGQPGPLDRSAAGLGVEAHPAAGGRALAADTTDTAGHYLIEGIPVGAVRIGVDPATLPDSLQVFGLDSLPFVVERGDTLEVDFRVSFPSVSLAQVQGLESGRRVFTHGIVLNPRDLFGDSAVHLRAGDAYLRTTSVERVQIQPGDSVRVQGRTAREAGLPVLEGARIFLLRSLAVDPKPVELETGGAAGAVEGTLNAALVRVGTSEIVDTATGEGDFVATLDDGSGGLPMVLRDFLPFDPSGLEPSFAVVEEAVGLLVAAGDPDGGPPARWELLPRFPGDLDVTFFPLRPVDRARAAGEGTTLAVEGIVLNPVEPGGDTTVHVRQDGVNLRGVGSGAVTLEPGDSVRLRGTTVAGVAATALDLRDVTLLGKGAEEPPAVEVSTGEAAAGGGGARLEAALVRISGAAVVETETVDGQFVATVDDGTGPLDVLFREFVGFNTVRIRAGDTVLEEATGVLVAHRRLDGVVRWRLLPRRASDVVLP